MTDRRAVSSPCRKCKRMLCRTQAKDCHDVHGESLSVYLDDEHSGGIAHAASSLIDNGRAGTLNRVEEIIEFCKERRYTAVGVAYCFGLKASALDFCKMLEAAGLRAVPVSCTSGAVKEREIDTKKETEVVSCNPAGQALVLNRKKIDLVVEMGLCLGHDIIFHQQLKHDHTVLVVKDRTTAHNPAAVFTSHRDSVREFIDTLDDAFAMKSPAWLLEQQTAEEALTVIDLRSESAFRKSHIPGSIHIPLKQLPSEFPTLKREHKIVCVCNGSVQSAYAIVFLYSRGFKQVFNLSGGFSRWEQESLPTVSGEQAE